MANGAIFIIFLLLFTFSIVLAAWTFTDATTNSSGSEVLWAAVVLMAPILGFLLYFLVGRDRLKN